MIDTAEIYFSERVVGDCLRAGPTRAMIASKFTRDIPRPNLKTGGSTSGAIGKIRVCDQREYRQGSQSVPPTLLALADEVIE